MPNRLIRNTAILAKIETTYGVDSVPVGATNALLVSNLSLNPFNAQNEDRDNVRPYLGGSEQLPGTRYMELSFDTEFVGSGTVATAPPWGALARGCGLAETLTATFRTDYTPVSTGFESLSFYWFDDGVLHKGFGSRGNAVFKLGVGGRPKISWRFLALYNTPTAQVNPAVTLTPWKTPQVVIDANAGDIILGGTHATGVAPAITGGTPYPSQGLEIDLGNSVNYTALLGGETIDITQRNVSAKLSMDLTAAQEVAFYNSVELASLTTIGLQHGTVANNKVLAWLASAQLFNPQKAEVNGKRLVSYDVRGVPVAGNDELRIVTSF